MSIAVNSSGDCQCGSNSWTVRPGIGNNNWGGVGMEKWAEINRKYSEIWPVITEKKTPPADAKEWDVVDVVVVCKMYDVTIVMHR